MSRKLKPVRRAAKKLSFKNAKSTKEVKEFIKNWAPNTPGRAQGDPFGFGTGFSGGYPNTVAPPYSQLSDPSTLFVNLRWFFVSNFRQVLSQAYVEIALINTVVDVPVDDALRGGINILTKQLDADQLHQLNVKMDRENDLHIAAQGEKWNRLFGGGGILLISDQDPITPFDIKSITKDTRFEFRAVDLWELFWDQQNIDGYDPQALLDDETTAYSYYATQIDRTRVIRLKGLEAPSFLRPRLRGWGFSIVEKLIRSVNQYLKATDLGFEVLDEFKLDVYKIKNLVNTLMSANGQQAVFQRVQMANWQKNYQNAVVMDSEDDFDHKQLSFSGLAEAMAGIRMQVASDMRMPITKLFGTSTSAGIGNTDQNDMENYNSMVENEVRHKIKFPILRMVEIRCQQLFGFVPDDLAIEFKPLRVMTSEQEESVKNSIGNRILQFQQAGLISAQQAVEQANAAKLFPTSIEVNGAQLDVADQLLVAEDGDEGAKGEDDPPGANKEDSRRPRLANEKALNEMKVSEE